MAEKNKRPRPDSNVDKLQILLPHLDDIVQNHEQFRMLAHFGPLCRFLDFSRHSVPDVCRFRAHDISSLIASVSYGLTHLGDNSSCSSGCNRAGSWNILFWDLAGSADDWK